MRNKGKLVFWPAYFDTDLSWGEGRKVPKNLSLRGIKAIEIFKAAEQLDLDPVMNEMAAYSKTSWRKNGVVFVKKTGKKSDIMRDLARKMRQNRARK